MSSNHCLRGVLTGFSTNNRIKATKYTRHPGWWGGAMVLGKLPVPGRPTIWIIVGHRPTALAVGAGWGCLDIFLSSIISLFFLPHSGRRPDID